MFHDFSRIPSLTAYERKHHGKPPDQHIASQSPNNATNTVSLCLSMTVPLHNQARTGTDKWSMFLRQRRLKDQLRRLENDFKSCHCPPGCRGGQHNHISADPASLPQQDLHGPLVPVDSDMTRTTGWMARGSQASHV